MYDVRSQDNDYLYEKQLLKKGHSVASGFQSCSISSYTDVGIPGQFIELCTYLPISVCLLYLYLWGRKATSTTPIQAMEELPSHTTSVYFLFKFPGTRVT